MNLLNENQMNVNSKKIVTICTIGIIVIFVIILVLLFLLLSLKKNTATLIIDNEKYSINNYILEKDGLQYIGIEDLVKLTNNEYNYKSGNEDVEDDNKCYIINKYEGTFFEVDSKEFYKVSQGTNKVEYYSLENPIIKIDSKIYIPLSGIKKAMNCNYINNNGSINIQSMGYIESIYNRPPTDKNATNKFVPNSSIIWETTYENKKLLKENLVLIQDDIGNVGLGIVKLDVTKNKKITTKVVKVDPIITPKYISINYIEQYNQLIVENENGKGIIQLNFSNEKVEAKTKIVPQYESIIPINETLYLVSETTTVTNNNNSSKIQKYGIIDQDGNTVLSAEYDKIGINASKFTNNDLVSEYIIYEKYIPVKKNNLWGMVDLQGNIVIKLAYTDFGYIGTNANSNVLLIPELKAIVVKKDKNYGIIKINGEVLMEAVLTKVYKENIEGKEVYAMIYNDKKYKVIDYIESKNKNTNTNTNKNNNTTTNKNETKNNTTKNNITTNNATKKENTIVVKNNN